MSRLNPIYDDIGINMLSYGPYDMGIIWSEIYLKDTRNSMDIFVSIKTLLKSSSIRCIQLPI